MEKWKTYLFPFLSLLVFFLLDGLIAAFFTNALQFSFGYAVPRLTLLGLIFFSFHLPGKLLAFLAILFGLLYDSYYSGILGVYLAAFCLIAYIIIQLKTYFQPGWVAYLFLGVLMLLLNEFFAFSVFNVIGLVQSTYAYFWANHVGASLILNTIFLLVLIPILTELMKRIEE